MACVRSVPIAVRFSGAPARFNKLWEGKKMETAEDEETQESSSDSSSSLNSEEDGAFEDRFEEWERKKVNCAVIDAKEVTRTRLSSNFRKQYAVKLGITEKVGGCLGFSVFLCNATQRLIRLLTNVPRNFILQVPTPPQPALSCLPAGYTPVMERLKGQVESYGGFLRLMRRPNTTMAPSTSPTKSQDLVEPKSTNHSSGPPSKPFVNIDPKEVSCISSSEEKGGKCLVGVLKHGKPSKKGEKKKVNSYIYASFRLGSMSFRPLTQSCISLPYR